MAAQSSPRPILWHLPTSHYGEKVRWALDYKRVQHDRHAPVSGYHMAVALVLTRGRSWTFPILELDGHRLTDSTEIIAALERRYPDPNLYPADPDERRRALALEDWFDEQLGPAVRRFADLSAASLFYPLVMPPEGPLQLDPPPALAEVRNSIQDRRGYQWVNEMFARHRHKGAARAAQGANA